jgi:DNA-directed RNA polymerase subunit L
MNFVPNKVYANSGVFTFTDQTHTIGNLLRYYLQEDPDVQFSGYKVPHPLINELVLKVVGGDQNVLTLVSNACDRIINDLEILEEELAI